MPTFPANTLDDRDALLALLGSFWARLYGGRDLLRSILFARAQEERQTQQDYAEMVQALSRFTTPVYHRDNWYQLTILQSEMNSQPARYGEGYVYGNQPDGELVRYGQPVSRRDYVVPVPEELRQVLLITDRVTSPSVSMFVGVDFVLESGRIRFAENPFENENLVQEPVYTGSEVTDWSISVWLNQSDWDWRYLYRHFGYLLGYEKRSSLSYRDFINAVLDGWVEGTSRRHLEAIFAAILGSPVAAGDETVEQVLTDRNHLLVISDKTVYAFAKSATAVVAVGDTLTAGQQLTDTVTFYEFTRGETIDLSQLTLDTQFLLPGYASGLSFPNEEVPLVVEEDVDGKTKVSFQIGGMPTDVDQFFDQLHSRAAELGQSTLAELLDVRGDGQTQQPTAASLPATINPCQFLINNVLRYNFAAVRLKLSADTAQAAQDLQLLDARVLRRLIPPWQALLVLIELDAGGESSTLTDSVADGFGSEVDAESLTAAEDTLLTSSDLTAFIEEDVQIYYVPCPCG
jgi:hypothetical protein